MAAGDHQGEERKLGRRGLEHARQNVPLEVVHGNRRDLEGVGQGRRQGAPDHEGPDEAGACRIGDRVEATKLDARVFEHAFDHRQQLGDVVPGSELRHDAAVGRVNRDLAREPLGPDADAGFVERHAGLVAARFYAKYPHMQALQLTGGAANMPLFSRLSRPIFLHYIHSWVFDAGRQNKRERALRCSASPLQACL